MEEIKAKGFNMVRQTERDDSNAFVSGYNGLTLNYNKMKVGVKDLEDAVMDLGFLKKINSRLASKETALRAISDYDLITMREISDFFYRTSGIYNRIIRYMAFMYKYDWFLTPYMYGDKQKNKKDKLTEDFYKGLSILDNFKVKKNLSEIALKVLKQGAYYGYKVETKDGNIVLQELPVNYCRSRFNYGNKPAVEFNMKYFDETFTDTTQRLRVLKMFPKEFEKGYKLYKEGKLQPDFMGDDRGWYLLDPELTEKFSTGEDYPMFISVVPLILDLDEAQDLDRKKTQQRLLKIIIQKMPIDKNGELVFDVDEAKVLHNNAVEMLGKAIGIDVLTTYAEVEVANLSDSSTLSSQSDDLERVERQLFNEAGVSQMQFNTDGNIALEKSILNDAATMSSLIFQFEQFLNELLEPINKQPKKVEYRVEILGTTIYNYQDLAKLYKEQTQLGYNKMLPQVALGQSQSSILSNCTFENDFLDLNSKFIPPLQSSTMSSKNLKSGNSTGTGAGRPEKSDDEKSEKTIMNKESAS